MEKQLKGQRYLLDIEKLHFALFQHSGTNKQANVDCIFILHFLNAICQAINL